MSKLHGNKTYIIIHNNGPVPLNFDSFSHFNAENRSCLNHSFITEKLAYSAYEKH